MNLRNVESYQIGLDIGTGSVGWAVLDGEGNLCRFKGEPTWGKGLSVRRPGEHHASVGYGTVHDRDEDAEARSHRAIESGHGSTPTSFAVMPFWSRDKLGHGSQTVLSHGPRRDAVDDAACNGPVEGIGTPIEGPFGSTPDYQPSEHRMRSTRWSPRPYNATRGRSGVNEIGPFVRSRRRRRLGIADLTPCASVIFIANIMIVEGEPGCPSNTPTSTTPRWTACPKSGYDVGSVRRAKRRWDVRVVR